MAQPGDDGGFGALLDRDAFGAGHRAAANRRGMSGDGTGQAVGEISVISMKRQERHNSAVEIFDVFGLGVVTVAGGGYLSQSFAASTVRNDQGS
jgi:hypothetical protein